MFETKVIIIYINDKLKRHPVEANIQYTTPHVALFLHINVRIQILRTFKKRDLTEHTKPSKIKTLEIFPVERMNKFKLHFITLVLDFEYSVVDVGTVTLVMYITRILKRTKIKMGVSG